MIKKFNLIFLKDKLLLSSKQYSSSTDIQNEYKNYMTSLDFDSLEDIKEYISFDYKLDKGFVDVLITKFIENKEPTMQLDF